MITNNPPLNSGRLTSSSANTPNTSSAPGLDSLIASIRQGALPNGDNGAPAALKQVLDRSRLSNEDYRQILTASRQGFIALGTASRDLTVHCPGGEVRVNRFLLSCLSPYLRAIFGIRTMKDKENGRLELPGIPHSTFTLLCDYLHGADLTASNWTEVNSIIDLAEYAHKLQMPTILEACDRTLMEWFHLPPEEIGRIRGPGSGNRKLNALSCDIQMAKRLFSLPLPLTFTTLRQINPTQIDFCPESTPLALVNSRPQYTDIGPRRQQELLRIASEALQTSGASSSSMPSYTRDDRLRTIASKDLFEMFLVLMQPEKQEHYGSLLPDIARLLVQHFFKEHLSREDALWVWRIGKQHPCIRQVFDQSTLQLTVETSETLMSLPSFGCAVHSELLANLINDFSASLEPIPILSPEYMEIFGYWIENESLPLEILNNTKKTERAIEALDYFLCESYKPYLIDHFTHPEQLAWLIEFAIKENITDLLSECLCRLNKVYEGIVRVDEMEGGKLSLLAIDSAKIDTNLGKILGDLSYKFSKASIDSWSTRPAPLRPMHERCVYKISDARNENIIMMPIVYLHIATFCAIGFLAIKEIMTYTWKLFEYVPEDHLLDSPTEKRLLAPIPVALVALGLLLVDSLIVPHIFRLINANSFSLTRRVLNYVWPPVTMTPRLINLSMDEQDIQTPLTSSERTFSAENLPRDLKILDMSPPLSSQLTNDLVRDIVLRCPDIANLTIQGPCPRVDGQGWAHLARLHNLETLNVTLKCNKDARKAPLADLDLSQLVTHWPNFKKLIVTLKNPTFGTTRDELVFLQNCPPDHELRIIDTRREIFVDTVRTTVIPADVIEGYGHQLRSINIHFQNDQQMLNFLQSCPKLETMWIAASRLSNTAIQAIATHSTQLKHLSLTYAYDLRNFTLEQLARLPELETLHISEAGEITDEGVEALIRIRQENNLPPLKGISLALCISVSEQMQKRLAADQLRYTILPAFLKLSPSFKESKQEKRDRFQVLSTLLDLLARNGGFLLAQDPEIGIGSILATGLRPQLLRAIFSEPSPIPVPNAITVSPDHLAALAQRTIRLQSGQTQADEMNAQVIQLLNEELSWIRSPKWQNALLLLGEQLKTHDAEDLDSILQMHLQQYSPIKMGVINQAAELCVKQINAWLAPQLSNEILRCDRNLGQMRGVELSAFQREKNWRALLLVTDAVLKIMADQCAEHGYASSTERTRFLLLVALKTIASLRQDSVSVLTTQLYGSAASQASSSQASSSSSRG